MAESYLSFEADGAHEEPQMNQGATPTVNSGNNASEEKSSRLVRTILWTSLGLAVVMGAIFAGLSLRNYRLGRRSPYESFSHAGEGLSGSTEYGVGI
jgi:hypothetical protein